MKNYLRALRHAWPYRKRLVGSCAAALVAAMLWGLNFTSIYPVLKLLHTGQSLHQWVDGCIANTQKDIDGWQGRLDALTERQKELEKRPPHKEVSKQKLALANEMLRLETRLQAARA